MDFFARSVNSVHDKRAKCVIDEIDRQRADRFRQFARIHKWWIGNSRSHWEESLAILRRALGDEHNKIDDYLNWYYVWYRPGRKPVIRNPLDLKKLWAGAWLHELYHEHNTPQVGISIGARKIAHSLNLTNAKTLQAIQHSLDYYTDFRERLIQVRNRHLESRDRTINEGGERKIDWIAIVLRVALFRNDLTEPLHFVEEWFRELVERYRFRRPDWNGDVSRQTLSDINERFEERVRSSLEEYTDVILKEVQALKKAKTK